ncbi:MAG: tRNA (adenosine(37)-N6)-threonylcarbamoyltransferase complex dimerization subunit type 1 TsaB [Ruminococcus sp.]|nr:tRNA (adenosine(37)-N6)-threonylcarbamoyltransferase complex dimerization subunit type 1 TsaB [Ruminococcus sp.]
MNALLILGIDTSGKTAAVALYENGVMLGQSGIYTVKTQSQVILPMVKQLMSDCSRDFSQLDLIAVSKGPGSYTGIRIGIAAVKAMALSLDIPCCGVSTLEGLAFTACYDGIVCPVMKARKDLVYTAVYKINDGKSEILYNEQIIETDELDKYLRTLGEKIILTGDGAEDFFSKYEYESYTLSPVHLRLQSAAGIILASLDKPHQTDDDLQASYLQIVKAEKDLIKAQQG